MLKSKSSNQEHWRRSQVWMPYTHLSLGPTGSKGTIFPKAYWFKMQELPQPQERFFKSNIRNKTNEASVSRDPRMSALFMVAMCVTDMDRSTIALHGSPKTGASQGYEF